MTEPLVLINLFSLPPEEVDGFVAAWESNIAPASQAPGFRGTRLHRAIDPNAPFPIVNIARWDSVEDWEATIREHFAPPSGSGQRAPRARPALYTVVHVTPDPAEATES